MLRRCTRQHKLATNKGSTETKIEREKGRGNTIRHRWNTLREAGNQGAGMTHGGRRRPKRQDRWDIRRTESMIYQGMTPDLCIASITWKLKLHHHNIIWLKTSRQRWHSACGVNPVKAVIIVKMIDIFSVNLDIDHYYTKNDYTLHKILTLKYVHMHATTSFQHLYKYHKYL